MSQEQHPCPLCGRTMFRHTTFSLYGHWICKKCYYKFANRRQLAFFIDILILKILSFVAYFILGLIVASPGSFLSEADTLVISLAIEMVLIGLFLSKDCFGGQSPGKCLCEVEVINVKSGKPGGVVTSFLRNIPLAIPHIAIFANQVLYSSQMLWDILRLVNILLLIIVGYQLIKGKRIGDGWAKSKVIWKEYDDHPMFSSSITRRVNSQKRVQSIPIHLDEVPHKQMESPRQTTSSRIVKCPHCETHVLPTSTGDCPSCRTRIR